MRLRQRQLILGLNPARKLQRCELLFRAAPACAAARSCARIYMHARALSHAYACCASMRMATGTWRVLATSTSNESIERIRNQAKSRLSTHAVKKRLVRVAGAVAVRARFSRCFLLLCSSVRRGCRGGGGWGGGGSDRGHLLLHSRLDLRTQFGAA